jgi:GINS complex subunit 1
MAFCTKGREILLDLQRSDFLPSYDEDAIRIIISEIEKLIEKMRYNESTNPNNKDANNDEQVKRDNIKSSEYEIMKKYFSCCSQRNIRYLESYLTYRLNKIKYIRWETGTVLPERIGKNTLSEKENDFFAKYNVLLSDYNDDIEMDLSLDLEPPKDLLIEARVLKDCGEVMTELGPIHLGNLQFLLILFNIYIFYFIIEKGSTEFLRRSDIEQLIRQGIVEQVTLDDI